MKKRSSESLDVADGRSHGRSQHRAAVVNLRRPLTGAEGDPVGMVHGVVVELVAGVERRLPGALHPAQVGAVVIEARPHRSVVVGPGIGGTGRIPQMAEKVDGPIESVDPEIPVQLPRSQLPGLCSRVIKMRPNVPPEGKGLMRQGTPGRYDDE